MRSNGRRSPSAFSTTLVIEDDAVVEGDGTVTATLSSGTGYTVSLHGAGVEDLHVLAGLTRLEWVDACGSETGSIPALRPHHDLVVIATPSK